MPTIDVIIVRRSAFESQDPWEIVDAVSGFVRDLGNRGRSADDFVPETLWNSQVTNAFAQINHNGPSLYFYNVLAAVDGTPQWDRLVSATRKGLSALGDIPQRQAYDQIIEAYELNRAQIVAGRRANAYFKVSNDFNLFVAFMPSSEAEDDFMARRAAWVRSLSTMRVVDDDKYEAELSRLG